MIFSIEIVRQYSCTHDLKDTDGYALNITLLGALLSVSLTFRNPFK